MGMKSAKLAGISVPDEAFEAASKYLWNMANENGGFGYAAPGHGTAPTTAVGILCQQFMGHSNDRRIKKGLDFYKTQESRLEGTIGQGLHPVQLVLRNASHVPRRRLILGVLEQTNARDLGESTEFRRSLGKRRTAAMRKITVTSTPRHSVV